MRYDQYSVPDTVAIRPIFFCFPLALTNIHPWPLVPFFQISLKNSTSALFPTTFLEKAVYIYSIHVLCKMTWIKHFLQSSNENILKCLTLLFETFIRQDSIPSILYFDKTWKVQCKQCCRMPNMSLDFGFFCNVDQNLKAQCFLSGPFRKQKCTSTGSKSDGLRLAIAGFCFSRLCSSRAWWPLAPNFCPRATRKSQIFHTNHMLDTLDFTVSGHWAPFSFR